MEASNSTDTTAEIVLIEANENQATDEDQMTPSKGVKRVAATPPEKEAKKPK
uniref:Uncharacterized protein n=1 Tax=Caenorhabditis japonica TaxID=281687 RepID=A0A8R1IPX1_CAEJA